MKYSTMLSSTYERTNERTDERTDEWTNIWIEKTCAFTSVRAWVKLAVCCLCRDRKRCLKRQNRTKCNNKCAEQSLYTYRVHNTYTRKYVRNRSVYTYYIVMFGICTHLPRDLYLRPWNGALNIFVNIWFLCKYYFFFLDSVVCKRHE